jgi:hypothetical protein
MARLPTPGGDTGTWGNILNDFILQTHNADGSLKNEIIAEANLSQALQSKVNTVASGGIADGSITSAQIADGTIVETDLSSAVVTKLNQTAPVTSVAGKTGAVTLVKGDVGLGNVDNTADTAKPVSAAMQTALNLKANDSQVVHLSGAETVTGAKTFSSPVATAAPLSSGHATTKQYVDDLVATVTGGGGTIAWGGVTGDIANQTDLATRLSQKADSSSLATVATSGSYSDLTNKPTIPAQLNATAGTNLTITGTYPNLIFAATGGGSVTDATTTQKGVVQLAGDLGGTAAAPTVPGLAAKADLTHTHAAADVTSGVLNAARLGSGTASSSTYLRGDGTWAAPPTSSTEHVAVNVRTSTYTLTIDDDGKAVEMNVSSATNLTVPSSASVNFPIGTVIEVVQAGVGQVVLVPAGGVTLRTPATLTTKQQWSTIGLRKRAADEWIVTGDLA